MRLLVDQRQRRKGKMFPSIVIARRVFSLKKTSELALSFRTFAKMSLLEWHAPSHSLQTVSLHYYEREELKKEFLTSTYPPQIRVDPQNRCAILNFYGDKVSVLP